MWPECEIPLTTAPLVAGLLNYCFSFFVILLMSFAYISIRSIHSIYNTEYDELKILYDLKRIKLTLDIMFNPGIVTSSMEIKKRKDQGNGTITFVQFYNNQT